MSASPIEQFIVKDIGANISFAGLNISFSNSALLMVISFVAIVIFYYVALKRSSIIPNKLQVTAEISYDFVNNIVKDNMSEQGKKFLPFIFSIFIFVLVGNLFGLIPFGFAFTAQPAVTMFIAIFIFVFTTIYGFIKHGFKFLKLFAPSGIPLALMPFMFVIELISYLAKSLSMGVRLFANIMSGHILVEIVAGFVIALGVFGILPLTFTSLIYILEFAVACLQAYALTILACLYIEQAISLH